MLGGWVAGCVVGRPSAVTRTTAPAKLGYRPALDGLRALAILPVVVFHSTYSRILPGGANGVDLFFVLSGFLITTLLLEEHALDGRISIGHFYARRAVRLGPALLLFVAAAALFSFTPWHGATGSPAEIGRFSLALLTYTANWVLALQTMTWPAFLGHLWSLSVEEQFYLVWPLVLTLVIRQRVRAMRLVVVLLAVIAALSLWRAILWHLTHDVHRVIFGTDCRANGILLGAVVALLLRTDSRRATTFAPVAGLAALLLYVSLSASLEQPSHVWLLGLKSVELASGVLVLALAADPLGRWHAPLAWPMMTWIGRRSYGIYLWHVAGLWGGLQLFPGSRAVATVAGVGITLAFASLSYECVERPALKLRRRFERPSSAAHDDALERAMAVGHGAYEHTPLTERS